MIEMFAAEIIHQGFLTTVQDLGRFGNRHLGVPVSGAADCWALITANGLVGNEPGAACLEITMAGPSLLFNKDCIVAITGADMSPRISGREAPCGKVFCAVRVICSVLVIPGRGAGLTWQLPVELMLRRLWEAGPPF